MLTLACVLGLAAAQDAALIERLRALPEAGTAWYSYTSRGRKAGYLRIRASRAKHDAKEALQIDFEIHLQRPLGAVRMETTTLSRLDDRLTPIKIELNMASRGKTATQKATFLDGKVKIGEKESEVPASLVTSEAEVLLVRAMEHRQGSKIAYASWETEDMRAKVDHVLEVVGTEKIEIDGNELDCTKIRHSGKGCGEHFYWVDSDRRVVRMLFDGRKEMLLTTEEKAVGEK